MPECTAFGVKSRSKDASSSGRSVPPPAQPAARTARHRRTARRITGRHDGDREYCQRPMRRRVTFSRNLTLSLSRTCRCFCKYCAFATHQAHLHSPEEVIELLDGAARRRVKELLVLTGERPEVNAEVRSRLAAYGHEDFTSY